MALVAPPPKPVNFVAPDPRRMVSVTPPAGFFTNAATQRNVGLGFVLVLGVVALLGVISEFGHTGEPTVATTSVPPAAATSPPAVTPAAPPPAPPSTPTIPFRVVEQWSIPNGGTGRVLVISPANRNEADLRALGVQLRTDARNDRMALAEVYDDERAARMRVAAISGHVSKADGAFFDKHKVGHYDKNANSGVNHYNITVKGLNGPWIELDYH